MNVEFGTDGASATVSIDIAKVVAFSPHGRIAALVKLAGVLRGMADDLLKKAEQLAIEAA